MEGPSAVAGRICSHGRVVDVFGSRGLLVRLQELKGGTAPISIFSGLKRLFFSFFGQNEVLGARGSAPKGRGS